MACCIVAQAQIDSGMPSCSTWPSLVRSLCGAICADREIEAMGRLSVSCEFDMTGTGHFPSRGWIVGHLFTYQPPPLLVRLHLQYPFLSRKQDTTCKGENANPLPQHRG